jgi:hypothetical protein
VAVTRTPKAFGDPSVALGPPGTLVAHGTNFAHGTAFEPLRRLRSMRLNSPVFSPIAVPICAHLWLQNAVLRFLRLHVQKFGVPKSVKKCQIILLKMAPYYGQMNVVRKNAPGRHYGTNKDSCRPPVS